MPDPSIQPKEADLEAAVSRMLEESDGLDDLDLLQQAKLATLTRRFLEDHLRPAWFRSEAALAHAKLFLPDFAPREEADETLLVDLLDLSKARREYLCQVMLDFCAVDPELDEMPLAAAIERAREMECLGYFEKIAAKELKVKAKDLKRLKETASEILTAASSSKP